MCSEQDAVAENADVYLEHERELFKIEDGRIAALETQATAVIAAAIAVAAFFLASGNYATWKWSAVLATGAIALFAGLVARADTPLRSGVEGARKREAVEEADRVVRDLDVRQVNSVEIRFRYADAWNRRYLSAGHRLAVKRQWLRIASIAFAVEFFVAVVVSAA